MVTPISIKLTLSETIIFNLAQVRTRFTRLFDALLRFVFKRGGGGGGGVATGKSDRVPLSHL